MGYLDLGDALVIVPGGVDKVRTDLVAAVTDQDWQAASQGFGEPELATE